MFTYFMVMLHCISLTLWSNFRRQKSLQSYHTHHNLQICPHPFSILKKSVYLAFVPTSTWLSQQTVPKRSTKPRKMLKRDVIFMLCNVQFEVNAFEVSYNVQYTSNILYNALMMSNETE